MGRMNALALARVEARPVALKLLLEVRYDLQAAYGLAETRMRDGSLHLPSDVLYEIIRELHAQGEPLKGVTVVLPERRWRDVG